MAEVIVQSSETKVWNILSLGAGVQSSTVLLMSCRGVLPRLDAAIFADTRWEPKAVYDHLEWLKSEAGKAGIPVLTVTKSDIRADALRSAVRGKNGKRSASIPYFTEYGGQLKRQCTNDYKIEPIKRKIREFIGVVPRERIAPGTIQLWLGISADEAGRVRMSRDLYIKNVYPLLFMLGRYYTRTDCKQWLTDNGYSIPPKSSCLGCPFHSDAGWKHIQENPDEWADVVEFDEKIRSNDSDKFKQRLYLHPSRRALSGLVFPDEMMESYDGTCDEGYCGV